MVGPHRRDRRRRRQTISFAQGTQGCGNGERLFLSPSPLECLMEHLWSPRERAAAQLRRGRYVPQVDLLEDRLAPGDTVLSQVLGLSLFGSGLGLGDGSVS